VVEPFMTIASILEMEFSWIFLFLITYPILRGLFVLYKRRRKRISKRLHFVLFILKDIVIFSFKVLVIAVLIVLIFILTGTIFQGFLFINRYFMVPIQIALHSAMILITIKFCYVLLKLFHPNLKLKYPKSKISKKSHKSAKYRRIKNEFMYYVGIGCLLLGINIVLISTYFPTHKIIPTIPLNDDEFLIDLHIHTVYSDGWLTPEERVLWYIDHGISIAAFSDHDNLRGARAAIEFVSQNGLDFEVLIAEEWTDHENDIHMNYFGLNEEIVPLESYTPGGPKAMNASDLISYVKNNGGFITVNHYNYDPNPEGGNGVPYTLEQLRDWGVDGFEIVNGGSYSSKYLAIRQFCLDNNLTCLGGSDIHTNEDLNTFIKLRLVDPTNKTVENIFRTLNNNTHEVVAINFLSDFVDIEDDLKDIGLYVIDEFINYLFNNNPFQTLSWIGWSSGIYFLLVLIYWKLKKTNLTKLNEKLS
jgi:hypothetical protein